MNGRTSMGRRRRRGVTARNVGVVATIAMMAAVSSCSHGATDATESSSSTAQSGTGRVDDVRPEDRGWQLLYGEEFDSSFDTASTPWVRDPMDADSPWHVDGFDDNGDVWKAIGGPEQENKIKSLNIFRKRAAFGQDGWLTAEVAAVDKDHDGVLDSDPSFRRGVLPNGQSVGMINEPSWDAGVLVRPSKALPPQYRIETTLRSLDFGGKRHGSFEYDNKFNGYSDAGACKTGFPWSFAGGSPGKGRCDGGSVKTENGFYYLTILDHDNPAPASNPGIHFRRRVIMDGYYADVVGKYGNYSTCNPKTGQWFSSADSNYVGVNAIFPRGDKFRKANNYIGTEYEFRTPCGTVQGDNTWGSNNQFNDIATSVELQPELMPDRGYTFAVERSRDSYVIEYSGDFKNVGQATYRFERKFVENGIPIWHYNQTPGEYDGQFNKNLTHRGAAGEYVNRDIWPAGSAYPDSFVIGDPHLNYYEGSAAIDNVRLYVPKS